MRDYKKALECLNYLVQFVRDIQNPNVGSTGIMFDKNGEIIMRTDIGYWEEGNVDLRSYLMKKATEAIPIEWIEEQMAEREDYGDFNTAAAIGYLLLSWEDENNGKDL